MQFASGVLGILELHLVVLYELSRSAILGRKRGGGVQNRTGSAEDPRITLTQRFVQNPNGYLPEGRERVGRYQRELRHSNAPNTLSL